MVFVTMYFTLYQPMYHAGFIKTVIRILRCVSYHTSKLLVDKVGFSPLGCLSPRSKAHLLLNPCPDGTQVPPRLEDPGPRQAPAPYCGHVWAQARGRSHWCLPARL